MLKSLFIQNYALIDRLEVSFQDGFSVITGETGAGKSIILGALSLILGQRFDSKSIKDGANKCIIEGCFDISAYKLAAFFEENEIEYDTENCLLRRELLVSGKSRAFINDTPVSLVQLKDLGLMLIDIHSQHQNLLLSDADFQLRVLDLMANNKELLLNYQTEFKLYKQYKSNLKQLIEKADAEKKEEDYLRFQYNQISEIGLRSGEQEELEHEQNTLTHAEEIKGNLFKINALLSNDESGAIGRLREAVQLLSSVSKVYAAGEEMFKRLESNYIDLKDLNAEIEDDIEKVEFNPERLLQVEERLGAIYSLQQKHRVKSVEELLDLQDQFEARIQTIDSSDEEVQKMTLQVEQQLQKVSELANQLTKKRKQAAPKLANELTERVSPLGMPNVKIEAEFESKKQLDEYGSEGVTILFSANKNASLKPVSEIASGGEISRLMLCIKAMIAGASALPTIIFDEIDTGVSGEIADKMGAIMWEMAQNMQVVSITHLPQIASKGNHHYRVYKEDNEVATATRLTPIKEQDRTVEIARMLSGAELTQAALNNAQELINQWKKTK
ncbi:MAG: DNA repair protein RecN [Bacteroidales bacterium]|nr:DNA repair protein RecN [Bacteroidales bacterium]